MTTAAPVLVLLPHSELGFARRLVHGDRVFAVFDVDGEPVVTDDACPHKGGRLSQGVVRGEVVRCPVHGYAFDLATGSCRTNDSYQLRRYPVLHRDGQWWVQIVPPKKLRWYQRLRLRAAGG